MVEMCLECLNAPFELLFLGCDTGASRSVRPDQYAWPCGSAQINDAALSSSCTHVASCHQIGLPRTCCCLLYKSRCAHALERGCHRLFNILLMRAFWYVMFWCSCELRRSRVSFMHITLCSTHWNVFLSGAAELEARDSLNEFCLCNVCCWEVRSAVPCLVRAPIEEIAGSLHV